MFKKLKFPVVKFIVTSIAAAVEGGREREREFVRMCHERQRQRKLFSFQISLGKLKMLARERESYNIESESRDVDRIYYSSLPMS